MSRKSTKGKKKTTAKKVQKPADRPAAITARVNAASTAQRITNRGFSFLFFQRSTVQPATPMTTVSKVVSG